MPVNPYQIGSAEDSSTPSNGVGTRWRFVLCGLVYAVCCSLLFWLFSSKFWFLTPLLKLGLAGVMAPFIGSVVLADKFGFGAFNCFLVAFLVAFFSDWVSSIGVYRCWRNQRG